MLATLSANFSQANTSNIVPCHYQTLYATASTLSSDATHTIYSVNAAKAPVTVQGFYCTAVTAPILSEVRR